MSDAIITTTVSKKSLPPGLARAIAHLSPKGNDVKITAQAQAYVSTDSQVYTVANATVLDLDDSKQVILRQGVWGGDNGYNKPPTDPYARIFDPVFDNVARDVPLGGAIVVGTIGRFCQVYVHPETFAVRFTSNEVLRDAILDGNADAAKAVLASENALTDEECAILYVHGCLKSCDTRKLTVKRYAPAMESCVSRGLLKRAANGATQITTAGKALDDVAPSRGETRIAILDPGITWTVNP